MQWADDLLAPARAPEGRSHYDGQKALYLSATPEGCAIATKRYVTDADAERAIYPVHVLSGRIIDLRDPQATDHYGVDTTHRATEWQSIRETGARSPTWDISDKVRSLDLDGMLYASRTDPRKTHLTLFRWNNPGTAKVRPDGNPLPAPPT